MKMWSLLIFTGVLASFCSWGDSKIPEIFAKIRDPFKRPDIKVILGTPKSDLELFPTEQFKMVGVISGPDHKRAMLLGPDGTNYLVSENTKIGTRKGVILKITTSLVQVRERVINILGEEEPVNIDLLIGGGEKPKP